jgi:hypothetical protein
MTPLHFAVEYAHYETISYILNNHLNQIDFSSVDKFNRTVHELALIRRNNKIINLIEEKIKYKKKLDQANGVDESFFDKTQFKLKSFAKPLKTTTPQPVLSQTSNNDDVVIIEATKPFNIPRKPSIDEFKNTVSTSPSAFSSSPNTRQMNDTLNWLETQIFTENNSLINKTAHHVDLLDEIKNGRELVLTEAGKQLLEFTDDSESTKNLLQKLAEGFENSKNLSRKSTRDDENMISEDDDDDDDDSMINVVKRGRFSTTSPKSQTSNQFDIELDSFLNNFLNSR